MKTVIFDLETKKTAQEVGGFQNARDMGIAAIGAWRSDTAMYRVWNGDDLGEFIEWCNWAECISGFNHTEFDYKVLGPFINSYAFKSKMNVDMCTLIKQVTKRFYSLDKVAYDTLGLSKTDGITGKDAPRLFHEGKMDLLYRYLLDDVQITVKLFYHIIKFREVTIDGKKYVIPDLIATPVEDDFTDRQLTLL